MSDIRMGVILKIKIKNSNPRISLIIYESEMGFYLSQSFDELFYPDL